MTQRPVEIDQRSQTLRGTAYLADTRGAVTQRGPAVVLLHGFTGSRTEAGFNFVLLGRRLAEMGMHAVAFDFRGSGESDGAFDDMLVSAEVDDAVRITQWTRAQSYVDRRKIGLLGFSLGGLVASCAAARLRDPIAALGLLAPTTVQNLSRHAGEGASGARAVVGPHTLRADMFDDLRTLDPLGDLARRPCPTLVVQGTADQTVTPDVSDHFIQAVRRTGASVQVEMIDGANHVFNTPAHRQQMIDCAAQFFADRLID
ncbi:MAG: hypothetical protein CMJ49_02495 [Planctomycetaceae bacterium]|nr:hypothetical protein [Planctomycetaceae bacterium]